MSDYTATFKTGCSPPADWVPGATISLRNEWWLIDQTWRDTQDTLLWNVELDRVVPKPRPIRTFDKVADPHWSVGSVVDDPNGNPVEVVDVSRTFATTTYFGRNVPPDSSEIEAMLA